MRFEEFETEMRLVGQDEADGFAARVETEQAWKVAGEDIVARNYNLDIKNPHVGEQISHDPEELLASMRSSRPTFRTCGTSLKDHPADALSRGEQMHACAELGGSVIRPIWISGLGAAEADRRGGRGSNEEAGGLWRQEVAGADSGVGGAGIVGAAGSR